VSLLKLLKSKPGAGLCIPCVGTRRFPIARHKSSRLRLSVVTITSTDLRMLGCTAARGCSHHSGVIRGRKTDPAVRCDAAIECSACAPRLVNVRLFSSANRPQAANRGATRQNGRPRHCRPNPVVLARTPRIILPRDHCGASMFALHQP
jgi:hypothetical protein